MEINRGKGCNQMFRKYICVKQHDEKDCAAACLATISRKHGLKIPIAKIREYTKTDLHGTTALGIVTAAEKLGFNAKAVRCNMESLFNEEFLPAIAHVYLNDKYYHYMVIHKATRKKIIVADPEKGIVEYSPEDFSKIWTGVLLLMMPSVEFRKGDETTSIFSRFMGLLKPQRGLILNIFFASIFYTILGIIGSFYFRILMDDVLQYNIEETLHVFSIGFVVLSLFSVILNSFRTQLLLYLSQRIDIPLMLGYYKHVIDLPMSFFSTRQTGEIISRFNDATKIREAISGATLTIMIDTLMAIAGGCILYNQNQLLFGITIVPVVLYAIIVWSFNKPIENVNREAMENNAQITSYLFESLNGIETVKAFNAERKVNLETETRLVKLIKSVFKNGLINNIQISLKSGIKSIFGIVLLWIGAYEVLHGNLTIGELLSFNALLVYFITPIENLINLQPQLQTAIVAADRLGEILDLELEKSEDESKKIMPATLKGDIEFKNINFRYGTRPLLIKGLNLTIPQGERIALVGESGSGKTTLSKLLMNFYQCEEGEILINDFNMKDLNTEVLRDKIAYISQNIFLFNGTMKENLTLGCDEVDHEKVVAACKKAQIHDFINSLPQRYDTTIEENGSNLSGGEKQRLAIARAILQVPDIIIMDEATSNLDSTTEKAIEKTMHEFSSDITTIIIAHRLSTIMRCDKIYVLEKGKIVESGSHSELMDYKGDYYSLWKDQLPDYYENEKTAFTQVKEVVYSE